CVPPRLSRVLSFHRAHPSLPSFPTRRSSDLEYLGISAHPHHGRRAVAGQVLMRSEELEEGQEDLQQMLLHRRGSPRPVGPTKRRSEEHTSELQSRFDLVCRLLLEKKKQHM